MLTFVLLKLWSLESNFELKLFPISILFSFHNSHLGIEYTLGRIPMASCDFSMHPYSYDDNSGDFNLTKFSLTQEDKKFKVTKSL